MKKSMFTKIVNDENFSLYCIEKDQLSKYLSPMELGLLISLEAYSISTDILLENMLYYFEEVELYEYCKVVWDEMTERKDLF